MRLLHNLVRLPLRHYPLYGTVWLLSGLASLLVRFVPFRRLSRLLGSVSVPVAPEPTANQLTRINQVGRAVTRVARYTPWRCQCFEQGLTAKLLLRLFGISSTLVFGVRYTKKSNIRAHAWLDCGSQNVLGGISDREFSVIAVFT